MADQRDEPILHPTWIRAVLGAAGATVTLIVAVVLAAALGAYARGAAAGV